MIYIVLPVHNRVKLTLKCIESLYSNDAPFTMVVVDDGSTDGTSMLIKEKYPNVIILEGDGNLWWTASINKAIRFITESFSTNNNDYILCINNDLIVDSNYLSSMLSIAYQNSKRMVGSISVDIHNQEFLSFCGVKWNSFTAKYNNLAKSLYKNSYLNFRNTIKRSYIESDFIPGRGMLFPIRLIENIGLFDELNFPQYASDYDFSLRAKNVGYQLVISTNSIIKSHTEKTGIYQVHRGWGFRRLLENYTSIKSPVNLKTRYRWAKKHGEIPLLYLFFDSLRVGKGNVKKLF